MNLMDIMLKGRYKIPNESISLSSKQDKLFSDARSQDSGHP